MALSLKVRFCRRDFGVDGFIPGSDTIAMNKSALSRILALSSLAALSTAACATDSVIVTGSPRAPISPAEVKIYSQPPPMFEEVAILNASKSVAFTTGGQKTVDKVIEGLKEQAAKVGANGVLLEGFSHQQTGAV